MIKFKKVNFTTDAYTKYIYDDVKNTLTITSLQTNPLEIPLAEGGSGQPTNITGDRNITVTQSGYNASIALDTYLRAIDHIEGAPNGDSLTEMQLMNGVYKLQTFGGNNTLLQYYQDPTMGGIGQAQGIEGLDGSLNITSDGFYIEDSEEQRYYLNHFMTPPTSSNPIATMADLSSVPGTEDYNELNNKPGINQTDPFGYNTTQAVYKNAGLDINGNFMQGIKGLSVSVGDSQDYGYYGSDSLNGGCCKPENQGIKIRGLQQLGEAGAPFVADHMPPFQGIGQFNVTRTSDGAISKYGKEETFTDIGYALHTPYYPLTGETSLDIKLADKEFGLSINEGSEPIDSDPCPSSIVSGGVSGFISLNMPEEIHPNAVVYFGCDKMEYSTSSGSVSNLDAYDYPTLITFYDSSQNVIFQDTILGNQENVEVRVPYATHRNITQFTVTNQSPATLNITTGGCALYQNDGGLQSIIPAPPTTAGSYHLRCVILPNGEAVYSWEGDS